jgi:hypothetical protein
MHDPVHAATAMVGQCSHALWALGTHRSVLGGASCRVAPSAWPKSLWGQSHSAHMLLLLLLQKSRARVHEAWVKPVMA